MCLGQGPWHGQVQSIGGQGHGQMGRRIGDGALVGAWSADTRTEQRQGPWGTRLMQCMRGATIRQPATSRKRTVENVKQWEVTGQ